ncbi:MAG: hypothetical protein M1326_09640 [Cyanobacteria bacterium]|nr:hypothetical protein [Cyanobacteriota bacterium]
MFVTVGVSIGRLKSKVIRALSLMVVPIGKLEFGFILKLTNPVAWGGRFILFS